jgi:hypothetical protein
MVHCLLHSLELLKFEPHSILKFMLARVRVGQVFRGRLVDGARLGVGELSALDGTEVLETRRKGRRVIEKDFVLVEVCESNPCSL